MQRAVAIVNPAAGGGRGARLLRTLGAELRGAGIGAEVVVTPAPGEAARLAAAAADEGYPTVIAVGGDGTANEVANGLVGTTVALALYPIGAGNDLARTLGYPRGRGRESIARAIARFERRSMDVGELNGRLFLNATGVGIDGYVAERVRATARVVGRRFGFLVGALVGIATYRPQQMEVRIEGTVRTGRFLTVVASNGVYFGGGMKPAPRALLDDGMLDVTVAGDLGRIDAVMALARLYRGTHANGTTIVSLRAPRVDIELERPLPVQLDGEVTHAERLAIRVRPAALNVLAAPAS